MKKLIVMSIVSLMLSPSFAQVSKGNFILGGSFCIQSIGKKTDDGTNVQKEDGKVFQYVLGPHLHFMLSDHISIGGQFLHDLKITTDFEYPDPDDEVTVRRKDNTFSMGPVFRYWWSIGEKKKFGLFVQASTGWSTAGGKDEDYDFVNDEVTTADLPRTNSFFVEAYPGMFYAPAKRFFFEVSFGGFGLSQTHSVTKHPDSDVKDKSNNFKAGGSLDEMFFGDTAIGFNFVF